MHVEDSHAHANYQKSSIYNSILDADVIIVGKVEAKKWLDGAQLVLLEMRSPRIILDQKSSKIEDSKLNDSVLILSKRIHSFDSPIVEVGKNQILFLKRINAVPESIKGYKTDSKKEIFEICPGQLSSVPVSFSMDYAVVRSIQNAYEIKNSDDFADSIATLTSYKNLNTRELKISRLLKIISENKESKIYDKIAPMLLSAVILSNDNDAEGDKNILQRRVEIVDSPMPWKYSIEKRRFANAIVTLLNREHKVEYKQILLTLLSKLGLEPVSVDGKFRFEVPGKVAGSLWVGPLPE